MSPVGVLAEPPEEAAMNGGGGVVMLPSFSSLQPKRLRPTSAQKQL
jgi:hypothetical protein